MKTKRDAYAILIIDANDWDAEQVRAALRDLSNPVHVVGAADLDHEDAHVDLVILGFNDDVSLETTRSTLAKARMRSPAAQIILCVPRDLPDLDHKVREVRARAFVFKPLEENEFRELVDQTLSQIHLRRERQEYARSSRRSAKVDEIVGTSQPIRQVLELIDRVSESATTSVLLLGDSGVGKSLFAHTIHERSQVADGPFIEINCAAIPATLLESELFGYEPGAFTDARGQKIGLIELADGGTLFLDEITEIHPVTQAKLLKFLDSKRFRRLGGDREVAVEIRVIAATNRDIRSEVARGAFREDLYYRLNVVEIRVPALRERPGDVKAITNHYLAAFKKKFAKPRVQLSSEAMDAIQSYSWPGNVRELVNVLERAVLLCRTDVIEAANLPIDADVATPHPAVIRRSGRRLELELPPGNITLDDVERAYIEATLRRTRGNVSRAADLMGVSRGALRNKLEKFSIEPRAFSRPAFAASDRD
ncbi:MAG TPA: sigma-54 dependent transcriptional regulator [Candidatus Krumholzibacteria bacterium]|nr:sigma-54 dependent transcriptional regulator [Candidatus Krumholzibacteria bacterium]